MNKNNELNFLIIGAAKSGTTSLYHYLQQHPEIYLPKDKETHFFDDDNLFYHGKDFYLKYFFKIAGEYKARGEATPAYFHMYSKVIPRIKEFFEDSPPKFILVLRDPVHRAWSHYLHMVRNGEEDLSFEEALEMEPIRMAKNPNCWFGYYRDGLYAKQLRVWFSHFPKKNFFIFTLDELANDLHQILRRTFQFLEVDINFRVADLSRKNQASIARSTRLMKILNGKFPGADFIKEIIPAYYRRKLKVFLRQLNTKTIHTSNQKMNKETAIKLRKMYEADLNELERMLGRSFSHWRATS